MIVWLHCFQDYGKDNRGERVWQKELLLPSWQPACREGLGTSVFAREDP